MRDFDLKKNLLVFLITIGLFAIVFYVSNYFDNQRFSQIRDIQDTIAIDLLSSETQYSLLTEQSCPDIKNGSILSTELNSLAEKLQYTENSLGSTNEQVKTLKRYYTLLEIKDFLLMKQITQKCGIKPVFVLYFYSNAGDCPRCEEAGYVLTYLRQQYPELRVYAFDYDLDIGAVKTMISIYKLRKELPAVFVNNAAYYGLGTRDEFETKIPELKALKDAQEKAAAASSTSARLKSTRTATSSIETKP
jgi:hypothetical protein